MMLYPEPLKIEWEEGKLLVNNVLHPPSVRTAKEMHEVALDRAFPKDPQQEMYYMFRNIYSAENMQYDITVIASYRVGKEYAKTYGHYHPLAEEGMTFPEVYQVLRGNAAFILQKRNRDLSVNVLVLRAAPGEILLIPPNYGHVSVNLGEDFLVLANVVSSRFSSEYEEYRKNRGAAMYYTLDGPIHNTNYLIRKVERGFPNDMNLKYGFICQDLLKEFYNFPEKFQFLNKPSVMFRAEE